MAETISCPGCGKRYALRAELRGRRVKCSGCGNRFDVPALLETPAEASTEQNPLDAFEGAGEAYAVSAPPTPPPPAPSPAIPRTAQPSSGTRSSAPREWSQKERAWFRMGLSIVAFGAAATVLPFFGLQFRSLARMGEESWKGGVGVMIVGAVMSAAAALHHARAGSAKSFSLRKVLLALAAIPVAYFLLIVTLALVGRARYGSSSRPPPRHPGGPDWAAGPMGPGGAARPGGAAGPIGPRMSPVGRPSGPGGSRVDYEAYVAQFGADRVVRVIVTGGPPAADLPATRAFQARLRDAVKPLLPTTGSRTSTAATRDGQTTLITAPLEDLDAVEKAIDFGTVTSVDPEQRIIHVTAAPAAAGPSAE